MVLPPIVVDRRFHIFMNSIPYPKGSLNVLIAHFGTFSCKCGIRTEINSLFNKRGSKRRKSNSPIHQPQIFLRFFRVDRRKGYLLFLAAGEGKDVAAKERLNAQRLCRFRDALFHQRLRDSSVLHAEGDLAVGIDIEKLRPGDSEKRCPPSPRYGTWAE